MMSLPQRHRPAAQTFAVNAATFLHGHLRFAWRAALLCVHVAYGLLLALAIRLNAAQRVRAERLAQQWSTRLLRILGLRLRVHGVPIDGGGLIVANHVSWLDIPVLSACLPTRFVSKSEVRQWPVAGWLADAAGTFYIRRGKGGSRPLLNRMAPYLGGGGVAVVFPEGTTTTGQEVLSFHPRLFAAAIESRTSVQAVALRYGRGDRGAELAPFVGDDDLVSHLLRLLRNASGLSVELHFCPRVAAADRSREELALQAHAAVSQVLDPAPNRAALVTAGP